MTRPHRHFRWVKRPQLLVAAGVLCLLVGASGSVMRAAHLAPLSRLESSGSLLGAPIPAKPSSSCIAMPCIALSFDDGPNPITTPRIMDILESEHIKATFFVVGQRVPGNEPILRRMYYDGDEIGNHSWNHPDFTKLSQAQIYDQIQRTQSAIVAAGVPAPHLLRPPYGSVNAAVLSQLQMTIVRWDIDPEDWHTNDVGKIQGNVLSHARPGGIILMHDIYPSTVDALRPTLDALKSRYQIVTVSQLMHFEPGDQGQYFGR